jgi:hypothetical protein
MMWIKARNAGSDAGRTPRRTRSIRWDESIRNFDANLAIEADRTRMERQVGQCWGILSRSEQFYTDVLKY